MANFDLDFNNSQSSQLGEDEMEQLEASSKPENTNRATKSGMRKFQGWLDRRNKVCDFASISAEELNSLLRQFYAEVKHAKPGQSLTPSSMTGFRAAIHRTLTSAPYLRPFNILKGDAFTGANTMFHARCRL